MLNQEFEATGEQSTKLKDSAERACGRTAEEARRIVVHQRSASHRSLSINYLSTYLFSLEYSSRGYIPYVEGWTLAWP